MLKDLNPALQSQYEDLLQYLDVIFLSNETLNLLKYDEIFQDLIIKDIQKIITFESNYSIKVKQANKFINAFNLTTRDNFSERVENIDNSFLLEDDLKNSKAYLQNNLNHSFEEITNALQNHSKQNIKEKPEPLVANFSIKPVQPSKDIQLENSANLQEENQDLSSLLINNHQEEIANRIVQQQAVMILNAKLASGAIYAFKKRPKIIPILKWLTVSLLIVISLLSLVAFIVIMFTNEKISIMAKPNLAADVYKPTPLVTTLPFPFQAIIFIALTSILFYAMLRKQTSLNYKFRFAWPWMIFYILLLFMVSFLTSGIQDNLIFDFKSLQKEIFKDATNLINPSISTWEVSNLKPNVLKAYNLLLNWRSLQFSIYGLISSLAVITILGVIFNPKRDFDRINNILNTYISDIKNGKLDLNSVNSFSKHYFWQNFF